MVPLRYKLQNGDTIEVVTNTQQTPNKDWLRFVKTAKAQARIANGSKPRNMNAVSLWAAS